MGLGSHERISTSNSKQTRECLSCSVCQTGHFPLFAKHAKGPCVAWVAPTVGHVADFCRTSSMLRFMPFQNTHERAHG